MQAFLPVAGVLGCAVLAGGTTVWLRRKQRLDSLQIREEALDARKREVDELLKEAKLANELKTEFLANMSHEIRTPMNGILGMTDLALSTKLTAEQREYLTMVRTSAGALLAILNEILDYSKIESGKLEVEQIPFVLRKCVEDAVKTLALDAMKKGLALSAQIAPDIPDVVVSDPSRIRQVLLNLITNAIKFTARGRISVLVDRDAGDPALLRVAVSDTGLGVPPEKHKVIFEAFRQADGSTTRLYGGTGLGLTICTRLVSLMGGRIWVESEPGKGSTFFFTIRAGLSNVSAHSAETVPGALVFQCSSNRLDVLVADDNPVNQRLVVRTLEKSGHRVTAVKSGAEAIDASGQQVFDVILMDIQMPGVDGIEATAAIRAREAANRTHTPIVAMTASVFDSDRQRCLEAGMDAFLSKPIDLPELVRLVESFTPESS